MMDGSGQRRAVTPGGPRSGWVMTGLRYVTLAAAATLTLGCAVERIKYVGRLGGSEGSGGGTQPVTGGSAGAETGGEGGAAASSTGGSVVPAGTRCYGEPPEQSGGADGACARGAPRASS